MVNVALIKHNASDAAAAHAPVNEEVCGRRGVETEVAEDRSGQPRNCRLQSARSQLPLDTSNAVRTPHVTRWWGVGELLCGNMHLKVMT